MRLTSHWHDEERQDAGLSPRCTIAVEQDIKSLSQISSEHHRDPLTHSHLQRNKGKTNPSVHLHSYHLTLVIKAELILSTASHYIR